MLMQPAQGPFAADSVQATESKECKEWNFC